jgi:spermidine synthase
LAAVALMFLSSGASALMYEVVWTRQLTTFFGSTLYGVATVLSAFMGGLALGSWLIGGRADKFRQPLRIYGLFEIAIGVAALLFPFLLRATQPLIGSFYVTGGEGTFYLFSLVRFVVVFSLLLIPTTMMGATLPLLSKALTSNLGQVGHRVGGLYALNTIGAVLGVFLAGFFLLEHFGVSGTTWIAVAINLLVGGAAWVIGGKHLQVEPSTGSATKAGSVEPPLPRRILITVLATYGISGFVALAYQVVWTRSLIFSFETLKATTYSFSGMLLVFLTGLAVGSAIMQAIVDRQRNLLRLYALLQTGIGLTGGLSWFFIVKDLPNMAELNDDGSLRYWTAVGNVLMKTAITIGGPTLLMGMAFPVVARLVIRSVDSLGFSVARVYALNTLGAILGSFAAGFILVPSLGLVGTLALLTAINLTLAFVLAWQDRDALPAHRMALLAIIGAALLIVPIRLATSRTYLQRLQPNEKMVHYEEGAMATISVVENNSRDRMIYVDDVGVAGTDKIMLTDQKSLAHVPMVLLGAAAERTLSVGFGSGGASFSYTLYPNIKEIHTIEIAPEVPRAAHTLTASNHGIIVQDRILADAKAKGAETITGFRHPISDYTHTPLPGFKTFDPRLKVLIDDARCYLRFTQVKYDVIATDCTDLRYKTNANLYDLEYFSLCREAITDRGLVVVWMPLAGLSDMAFSSALRTFQEVFPEMGVWYFTNQPTHYCLLIGGKGPVRIDYPGVVRAAALPGIAEDLEEIGLRDPDKLISSFVCDERTLTQRLKPYPLNTEDRPFIEFESPRFGYDSRPLRDNQAALYAIQVPASTLIDNLPSPEVGDRIWKLQQANEIVFRGHCEYRLFRFPEAAKLYMEALAMVPFDSSIERLLNFEELVRHYETSREKPTLNTLWVAHGLAQVFLLQDRLEDAVGAAAPMAKYIDAKKGEVSEDVRSAGAALNRVLAEAYRRANNPTRAAQFEARAAHFD